MIKLTKKNIIVAFLIIAIIFVVSIFGAYYLKELNKTTNNISVEYASSGKVSINNKLPISDTLGKNIDISDEKQGYITFSVKNKSDNNVTYEILVTKKEVEKNQIRDNYIRLYLTDESDNPVSGFEKNLLPTFDTIKYLNDKPASKLLYRGKLKGKEKHKFKLRAWVCDSYAISDDVEEFMFDVSVREK